MERIDKYFLKDIKKKQTTIVGKKNSIDKYFLKNNNMDQYLFKKTSGKEDDRKISSEENYNRKISSEENYNRKISSEKSDNRIVRSKESDDRKISRDDNRKMNSEDDDRKISKDDDRTNSSEESSNKKKSIKKKEVSLFRKSKNVEEVDINTYFLKDYTPNNIINIFCDGGTINNGKKNAVGGIGVYNESENIKYSEQISFRKFNKPVTNNICELYAIQYAIENYSNSNNTLKIYTDSLYCINIFTKWAHSWEVNNWRKKDKKPILNLELIKYIHKLVSSKKILFEHCNSHQQAPMNKDSIEYKIWYGNFIADELATKGINEKVDYILIEKIKKILNDEI
jgi:ribonuclease HI